MPRSRRCSRTTVTGSFNVAQKKTEVESLKCQLWLFVTYVFDCFGGLFPEIVGV